MRALTIVLASAGLLISTAPALGASAPTPATAENPDDPMVCKKFVETGSLVKKRKVCLTKSEWARVQTSQREGSQKMVQDLTEGFRCEASTIGC